MPEMFDLVLALCSITPHFNYFRSPDKYRLVVEIEQWIFSELGELRDEPIPHQCITVGLNDGCRIPEEAILFEVNLVVRQSSHKTLHILVFEVLELIAAKLLTAAGGVAGGCAVALAHHGQAGDFLHQAGLELVFFTLTRRVGNCICEALADG